MNAMNSDILYYYIRKYAYLDARSVLYVKAARKMFRKTVFLFQKSTAYKFNMT